MSVESIRKVEEVFTGGKARIEQFLKYASNMFAYSFDEISELFFLAPEANAVAMPEQWAGMSCAVRDGEEPIILSNGKILYDVKQTSAPKGFSGFVYTRDAIEFVKRRLNINSRSLDSESVIYDYLQGAVSRTEYTNKELLTSCLVYSVFERLGLRTDNMSFDFSGFNSIARDDRAFDEFGRFYQYFLRTAILTIRDGIWNYEKDYHKANGQAEKELSDREAFDDVKEELYNYRLGNSWRLTKVNSVYTNSYGVQIYVLGGINGDKFRVTLSKEQFEQRTAPVIIEDKSDDLAEQVAEKAEAITAVVVPAIKPSVVDEFKQKTYDIFKPVDEFTAEEIEGLVKEHIETTFYENKINAGIIDLAITGSRSRGLERDDSDIDVTVELRSDLKEDALFNLLHEDEFMVGDVPVDINPIRAQETGTLAEYLSSAEKYLADKRIVNESEVSAVLSPSAQEPVTLNYIGSAESIESIRDTALGLGATVTNANGSISISIYENHADEIRDAANELGLIGDDFEKAEEIDEDLIEYANDVASEAINEETDEEPEKSEKTVKAKRTRNAVRRKNNVRKDDLNAEQPYFPITSNIFEYILRCGNTSISYPFESVYSIVNQFQTVSPNNISNAEFLRNHFSGFGSGYIYRNSEGEAQRVCSWFDDEGITISAGSLVGNIYSTAYYTYEDAANAIERMLNNGNYCSQEVLDTAFEKEIQNLSETLWFIEQDIDYDVYSGSVISRESYRKGFPDSTEEIKNNILKKGDKYREYLTNLRQLVSDYSHDRDIMRFHFHKPDIVLQRLESIGWERNTFKTAPDFEFKKELFISDREIDQYFLSQGAVVKMDFDAFFEGNSDIADRAKHIKETYGISGGTYKNGFVDKDSKGIHFNYRQYYDEDVVLTYTDAAKRIERLRKKHQYIVDKDIQEHIRYLKSEVYHYHRDHNLPYINREFIDKRYAEQISKLKEYGIDTDELVEQVKARIDAETDTTIENLNEQEKNAVVEGTTPAAETAEEQNLTIPDTVFIEQEQEEEHTALYADMSKDSTDEEASTDDLVTYANQIAEEAAEEETIENEQLSFFSFTAPPKITVEKKCCVLLSRSEDKVKAAVHEFLSTEDEIKPNSPYLNSYVYGGIFSLEYKDTVKKRAAKINNAVKKDEFDIDYYLSLIPSPVQDMYKRRVAERHLSLVYDVEKISEFTIRYHFLDNNAEIAGHFMSRAVNTVYNEHLGKTSLDVTIDQYELAQYIPKLNAAGYYPVSSEEIDQNEKQILTLTKVGAMYEMYGEDARTAANILGLTLLRKGADVMIGFPEYMSDLYMKQIKREGYGLEYILDSFSERSNKVIDVTASTIFNHLFSSFPEIMSKNYTYVRYWKGPRSGFEPLTIEWVGDNVLSMAHTYTQNGDLMDDPEIRLLIDYDNRTAQSVSFSQSSLAKYEEYEIGDVGNKDCNSFVTFWLNNIDNQNYSLARTVRVEAGADVDKDYTDRPLDEERIDLHYLKNSDGSYTVEDRLHFDNERPRQIAAITADGTVEISYQHTPDFYRTDIVRYANRRNVKADLFGAVALAFVFREINNGRRNISQSFELNSLREIAKKNRYIDRDIADMLEEIVLNNPIAPDRFSEDEIEYCMTAINRAIEDGYLTAEESSTKAESIDSFVLDETLKDQIYTDAVLTMTVHRDASLINLQELSASSLSESSDASLSLKQPEPDNEAETVQADENKNIYDYQSGDIIQLSADSELSVTSVNTDSIEVRDDNSGEYPVDQQIPIEEFNAMTDQIIANEEMTAAPDSSEDLAKNYIIKEDYIGFGTPRQRIDANIAAIELIETLENEKRNATLEEQEILAGYSGWGALIDVFDERKDNYSSDREKLRTLLSETEYEAAAESAMTAFYTQPVVIRSIYKALDNFGFKGGRILEPSMGVGNFFGMMPAEMQENSKLYGVELDRISGMIAKYLYPKANISVKGFEDTNFSDNSFDVVIGNVPFGDFKVWDTRYNKHNLFIHDYFFLKSIDKVKPGGIVAFITSKGTLDKKNSKFRQMLCERAELLGAVRLPNNTFKTDVISDIIFLKKRESISAVKDNWVDTEYNHTALSNINQYYLENPHMVCGTIQSRSTAFGFDLDVVPFEETTLGDALSERIEKIVGKYEPIVMKAEISDKDKKEKVYIKRFDDSIPNYCFGTTPDGTIVYRENDALQIVDSITSKNKGYYLAAIRLSRAARRIINVQQIIPDDTNREIIERNFEEARQELNAAYDNFAALGYRVNIIDKRKHIDFSSDFNYSLMCSLEEQRQTDNSGDNKDWVKASPLFERRTIVKRPEITHCETIEDAYMVCMNRKNRVDIQLISELSDKSIDEVISELDGSYIYRNPDKARPDDIKVGWEPADEYLSGNIRIKLERAKAAAELNEKYKKNVSALENVMPARISAADISCQLGASWLPEDVITQFMLDVLGLARYQTNTCVVEHDIPTATWYIKAKSSAFGVQVDQVYGNRDMNGLEVLEHSLNRRSCVIYDRVLDEEGNPKSVVNVEKTKDISSKQQALQEAFEQWVYTDAERTRKLENIYNELFNSERVRKFDGSFLSFEEMNTNIELLPHQKNAVARCMLGGNALLAHVVGAGKTFEIAAACMELKRVGAANKSLIVVPNHLLGQWRKEFLTLYPSANLLVATSDDFSKANRKRFTAKIATGDYDAIIMGYSTFAKIGISTARRKKYYEDEIAEITEHLRLTQNDLTERMLKKAQKQVEYSLKQLEYVKGQDEEITFEELGVDRLFVDEAHNFKNLQIITKLGRIKGIQTSRSKRAEDLLLKIRYINELQGDERGVVLATGTPISNSMTEMFTMQNYLQPSYLESKGLKHFDAWISDFGKIEKTAELNPTGVGFRTVKRCKSFTNLPELMVMYNRCTDIQTAEMLKLPIPKLKNDNYTICVAQPSEYQEAFIQECGDRADRIHGGYVDPSVDNMLCVTNDGKMCALDMRLVDPDAEDLPDSKINIAIRNIFNKWKETSEQRLTQVVFLDRSIPKGNGEFNLYDDIKNKLVERGIPQEEIAFIHDAKNDKEKLSMFDSVNSGKIRIILGSTEKMGAGTNIQTKLCALHHLDVPWRPSDIEQREGRILRRGNTCSEVEIFRYVTEKTFDAYSWQTIENKQRFISQVMTGEAAGRSAEDVEEAVLNYQQIKALATGDPRIKEHFDLQEEVAKLKYMKGSFDKAHISMREKLSFELPQKLQREKQFVSTFKKEKEYAAENSKPFDEETNPFSVTVLGKTYDKREDFGKKIMELVDSGKAFHQDLELGSYRGYKLSVGWSAANDTYKVYLKNISKFEAQIGESAYGISMKLDNLINKTIDKMLVEHSQLLAQTAKEIETCEAHKDDVFPQLETLKEKEKRLKDLTKELSLDMSDDYGIEALDNADTLQTYDSNRK